MFDVKSGPQSPILIGEFHVLIIFDHSTPIFVMLKPHVDKKSGSIPILVQSTFSQKNQQFWHLKSAQGPRCNSCPSTYVGVIGNDGKSWDSHGDSGEINGNKWINHDKPMDLTMNMIGKSSVQISPGHLWGSHQFFVTVKNMGIHHGNLWIHMGYNVVWIIKLYYQ